MLARLPWKLSTFTQLFMYAAQPGRPQARSGDRPLDRQACGRDEVGDTIPTVTSWADSHSRPPPSHVPCHHGEMAVERCPLTGLLVQFKFKMCLNTQRIGS